MCQCKPIPADEVRQCVEPDCDKAALGFSPYCAMHRHTKKITCRAAGCSNVSVRGSNCCAIHARSGRDDVTTTCCMPDCDSAPIDGSKYCQRHFLADACPSYVRAKANIAKRKPINPFIQLLTYKNDPCTIRVDSVIAIVGQKVHIDNHTVLTLAHGEIRKVHARIEEYYGGSIHAESPET